MSKIKQISFLFEGKRIILEPNFRGHFLIPKRQSRSSRSRAVYREVSAMTLVKHEKVRHGDPVITLDSGEKIRVYQGGDSSQMIAHAGGLIECFDEKSAAIARNFKSLFTEYCDSVPDYEQCYFPWEDFEDWA